MKPLRPIKVALLTLACGGCTSVPVRYYTLMPPAAMSGQPASAKCCKVQIQRVLIPPAVDRPELVTRSGDDQAVVLGNATWLAPLRDEIRGALSGQINLKLLEASAIGRTADIQKSVVFVDVTRFESVPAQYVSVTANWRVHRADLPKTASVTCETTARISGNDGISAIVQGYQQAIAKIADQIALDILGVGCSAEPA